MNWKQRYNEAHYKWSCIERPNVVKDGFYCPPNLPDVTKSSGLESFVINFLKWNNCLGEGVKTMGVKRVINGVEKWTKGGGRKGSSDIHAMFPRKNDFPIPIKLEVKIGKDTQKKEQLKYEKDIKKINGLYFIIKNTDDFFVIFDKYILYKDLLQC